LSNLRTEWAATIGGTVAADNEAAAARPAGGHGFPTPAGGYFPSMIAFARASTRCGVLAIRSE
jgi:hypothetical protein